jgi:hypothetical protein
MDGFFLMEPKTSFNSDKENLSVEERSQLLFKLGMPTGSNPTPDAKEALRILDSLQRNQPKSNQQGGLMIINPVTGINVDLSPQRQGAHLSFQNKDFGYNRPTNPTTKVQQYGIRATVNQMIDEIPAAKIDRKLDSRYVFEAIDDDPLDMRFKGEPSKQNARAKAYDRFTKGAFKAYPTIDDDTLIGYGNRISEDTWQPRAQGGKYGKYVKFDPTDAVKRLGKYAAGKALGYVPVVGPYMQGLMTLDQLVEGLTGTSPAKTFVDHTKEQFANEEPNKPETWVPRPMTLMTR